MEDPQVPTDVEDGKGELRHPARRLSDAEDLAATRRVMFGDGSPVDVLAGKSTPEPGAEPPDFFSPAPAEPAEAPITLPPAGPPPEAEAAHSADGARDAKTGAQPSLANVPQTLDAIIDSFPPLDPPRPDSEWTGPRADGPGFVPPPRLEPLDVSPKTGESPDGAYDVIEFAEQELLDTKLALGLTRRPSEPGSVGPPAAEGASEALPDKGAAEFSAGPNATVEFAEHARDPGAAVVALDLATVPTPHDDHAAAGFADAAEPGEAPAAHAAKLGPAVAAAVTPLIPPFFQEASDAAESTMPSFAAPLRVGGTPSFSVAPPPAFPEPQVLDAPPAPEPYQEPIVVPANPPLESPPGRPMFQTVDPEPEEAAAPTFDVADKIAAEANATAEALENLRRLLNHNVPDSQPSYAAYPAYAVPPSHGHAHFDLRGDPAPFAMPAPLLPLPIPPDQGRGRSIYVLGFLTGIVLAVVAGAALYFLINMG